MKAIQSAAMQALRENYNMYCDSSETTFREYVECQSQSDPNFFRWLFGEEFENDFDTDLTEEHKEAFKYFLDDCGNRKFYYELHLNYSKGFGYSVGVKSDVELSTEEEIINIALKNGDIDQENVSEIDEPYDVIDEDRYNHLHSNAYKL